ncbi:MAG: queuosine precursor transporter [Myxococcales bacterium]
MTRPLIPGILAMAAIVVASNILVQFLFGQWLTWGAFTYPLAFLVTDVMNRVHGPAMARRVVFAGFVTGVACSLVGTQITGEFGPLVTWRIALGSGLAFLTAQLLDVAVFDRMRAGRWWRAPLVSTLVGSSGDTAIFFTVAFSAALSGLVAWRARTRLRAGGAEGGVRRRARFMADAGVGLAVLFLFVIFVESLPTWLQDACR